MSVLLSYSEDSYIQEPRCTVQCVFLDPKANAPTKVLIYNPPSLPLILH